MAQLRPGPRWAGQPNVRQGAPGPAAGFPMQSFRPRGGAPPSGGNVPGIRSMGRPMQQGKIFSEYESIGLLWKAAID